MTLKTLAVAMLALLLLGAAAGCNKLKEIKGNIAGKVLNSDGSGRGYVTVVLVGESGSEVQRQTTEDTGNFFFSGVEGGTYSFRVENMEKEIPSEPQTIKLGLGKTRQVEIKLLPEQAKPE
jgi:hypothetical protein